MRQRDQRQRSYDGRQRAKAAPRVARAEIARVFWSEDRKQREGSRQPGVWADPSVRRAYFILLALIFVAAGLALAFNLSKLAGGAVMVLSLGALVAGRLNLRLVRRQPDD
jgi:hypothetical protein